MNKVPHTYILLFVILITAMTLIADGQNTQKSAGATETSKLARKAERAEIDSVLKSYTACKFEDGLQISRVDRVFGNKVEYLVRQTAKGITNDSVTKGKSEQQMYVTGDGRLYEGVSRTDGYRVMVDYKKPEFFANIRVDRSVPTEYPHDKDILIRWINFLNKERGDSEAAFAQEGYYNGFESYSVNRKDVMGLHEELGATLLFDDRNKIVTTVYFLNQHPENRVHKTTAEWKELREKFLNRFTGCVIVNLQQVKKEKE